MYPRSFTILIILLALFNLSVTASADCTTDLQDAWTHAVVESCSNVGVFSVGGFYDGSWEKLSFNYPQPWRGSFITVSVNGTYYSNSVNPRDAEFMDDYVTQAPTLAGDSIVVKWMLPEKLLVTQYFSLIGNGSLIKIELENIGENQLDVGVRLHLDTMLGLNDGAPIYLPGVGLKSTEAEYESTELGFEYWKAYNRPEEPTIVATGLIDPKRGLTYPSKVAIADWKKSKDTAWDYTLDESRSIAGDSAVLLYYTIGMVEPGESKTVLTGYGNSEPVLPPEAGLFGLTELMVDRVSGAYCVGQEIRFRADVLSAVPSSRGQVRLEVFESKNNIVYNKTQSTKLLGKNEVETLEFNWTTPYLIEKEYYTVKALLIDSQGKVINSRERKSLFVVDPDACKGPFGLTWLVFILLALVLVVLLILLFILIVFHMHGSIGVHKSKEGDKVVVKIINKTNRDLTGCVVEDSIPLGAEVDVTTIHIHRKGNKLVWDLGLLESGKTAVLEYAVKGVHVLPKAKLRWDGGVVSSN